MRSKRISHPAGRAMILEFRFRITAGALARRRIPFGLRGQTI